MHAYAPVHLWVWVCVGEHTCHSFPRATQFNGDKEEGSSLDGPQGAPVTTALRVSFLKASKKA